MMRNQMFLIPRYRFKCSKHLVLLWAIFFACSLSPGRLYAKPPGVIGTVTSTQQQAIAYIDKISELKASNHWPNIKPDLFLKNLKNNIFMYSSVQLSDNNIYSISFTKTCWFFCNFKCIIKSLKKIKAGIKHSEWKRIANSTLRNK